MTDDPAVRLAEEIRLLVELVVERASPWLERVVDEGHGGNGGNTGGHGWCPLCAVVGLARGDRPDVAAKLVEHATQLVALLRAVLADRWEPEEGVHMPGFQPPPRPGSDDAPKENGRVQHVPVQQRPDWDDAGLDSGPA